MHPRAQELYPIQAKYYRAMVFYQRARWTVLLWTVSIIPTSIGLAPRFLRWPWGIAPLFIQLMLGVWMMGWGMPWLTQRYLRCRRVYRVMNWKPQLRFSHARAWANWFDERVLPSVVPVEVGERYTVYGK
jgi:hypothetical protein